LLEVVSQSEIYLPKQFDAEMNKMVLTFPYHEYVFNLILTFSSFPFCYGHRKWTSFFLRLALCYT